MAARRRACCGGSADGCRHHDGGIEVAALARRSRRPGAGTWRWRRRAEALAAPALRRPTSLTRRQAAGGPNRPGVRGFTVGWRMWFSSARHGSACSCAVAVHRRLRPELRAGERASTTLAIAGGSPLIHPPSACAGVEVALLEQCPVQGYLGAPPRRVPREEIKRNCGFLF